MSEYIDNDSKRKAAIKDLIKDLHQGGDLQELKERFAAITSNISPVEIAAIEQELINDGLPVSEVQALCDVHVSMFNEALEGASADATPGHPVHTAKMENYAVEQVLTLLTEAVGSLPDPEARMRVGRFVGQLAEIEKVYLRKENLLFPILEKYGMTGPSSVMWSTHDSIRAQLKELRRLAETGDQVAINTVLTPLAEAVRAMFYKEDHILYPSALKLLNDSDWAQIRDHSEEIGYCLIRPGDKWQPVIAAAPAAGTASAPAEASAETTVRLDTGELTVEQINLLLTHLPVDVTFVDENGRVRYYSQGKERIFVRTPSIIGRSVQNCHPPASVHVVNRIVGEMKSGERDGAEFWIPMGEQFVHIRYFAVRDAQGAFKGVIEVSQNIAPLRALEGEKRLLDD